MTIVTLPIAVVPIGTVTIKGQQYDVATHPEFVKFFFSLTDRVGGATGPSTPDLSVSQFDDAGIEETKALHYSFVNEVRQQPADNPWIELEKRISALEQGISL